MKRIPLTQGKSAIVDDEDFARLNAFKWYAYKRHGIYYAARRSKQTRALIHMHRVVLGLKAGDGRLTDHINHDGLDNRKKNLRICTHAENQHNQRTQKGTSKYKGVCWPKAGKKWQAGICVDGKNKHLGLFDSEIEAARAYDRAAIELFGEFACLNF